MLNLKALISTIAENATSISEILTRLYFPAGLFTNMITNFNVVDLLKLENISDDNYNDLFTTDKPVIFNFHGYTNVVEELIYERTHRFDIIHGYEEEGTITSPFDMRVLNKIDRYHLVLDALRLLDHCEKTLVEHTNKIYTDGQEIEEVLNFKFD